MSTTTASRPRIVDSSAETLWFLGTVARMKLDGADTAGRFAMWEALLPRGAAPPLHSHPQDETFYVLDGELTVWILDGEPTDERNGPQGWLRQSARTCRAGAATFAPGGTPHTFRVESDTARMLVVSTPAGIEDMVRGLGEPARWPWLQEPPRGPRVDPELVASVEARTGMVRHGPPPPARAG